MLACVCKINFQKINEKKAFYWIWEIDGIQANELNQTSTHTHAQAYIDTINGYPVVGNFEY